LETGSFPKAASFGNYAFNDCTSLSSLILGNTPPTVDLIFNSLEARTITFTVPIGKKTVYEAAYATGTPWGGTGVTVVIVEG
jgi:hypothetical protein